MTKTLGTLTRFIALVAFVIVIDACSYLANNTPVQETKTLQVATSSPAEVLESNTSTPSISFHFEPSCWPTKPLEKGNTISGSLMGEDNNNDLFYWDVNSFRANLLVSRSKSWLQIPFVSPEGNFLTYFAEKNKLISISQNQTVSAELPLDDYFIDESLINDQLLVIPNGNREISSTNYRDGIGFTDVYYVYNQQTGQLTRHSTFLPKFTPNMYGYFIIAYSPDMRYVLYHSSLANEGKQGGFTLLDLTTQEIKWTIPESRKSSGGGDKDMPIWKPDASSLTYDWFSNGEKDLNFYTISLDGTITQFTQLEQAFGHSYSLFSQLEWSPNMRYLAFKANDNSLHGAQLLIWDDKEKTLLRPCLPADANSSPIYPFFWSFDSEHIKVNLPYIKGTPISFEGSVSSDFREIIIDIPNRVILELPNVSQRGEYSGLDSKSNYGILGWLNWEIP